LTLEEREAIEKLCPSDLSLTQIAATIGRSKNAVVSEVRRHGGRENYNALQAQNHAYEMEKQKRKVLSDLNKEICRGAGGIVARVAKFEESIELLSMQLDILVEQIEKITKEKE
jgi:IS30 family transposase